MRLPASRTILTNQGDHAALLSWCSRLVAQTPEAPAEGKRWTAAYVADALFHSGVTCLEVDDAGNALRFFANARPHLAVAQQVRGLPQLSCLRGLLHLPTGGLRAGRSLLLLPPQGLLPNSAPLACWAQICLGQSCSGCLDPRL